MRIGKMSWGKDLWDQGENIAIHTKRGIEFLERYGNFLAERYKVENEYARQLKLLTSKYMPKKREEEDCQFTHRQAFLGMLSELTDVANQHERVAEQFRDEIVVEISQIAKRLREQRKESLEEAIRLQNQLNMAIELMRKTMKDYNRAYKESEAAKLKYDRAESDMNLSRAEVEKAKHNSFTKTQLAEDAKNTYALQLQRTNEFQHEYYTRLLPAVFERLRELDESRVSDISRLMAKCVDIERNVLPLIQKCLQGMLEQSLHIDAQADSTVVIQRYKSGYAIPQDYPFDDLGAEGSSNGTNVGVETSNGVLSDNEYGCNGQMPTSPTINATRKLPRKPSTAGSIVSRVAKRGKLVNLFRSKTIVECVQDDYSDLPPQQQCKRLVQRIDVIQKQIETKFAQKDGLMRMQNVYRESPHLGDVSQVDQEYQKCVGELSGLQAELTKFQKYLNDAMSRLNVPINVVYGTPASARGCSESISSSSFSSFASTPASTPRAPPPNRPPPPVTVRSSSIPLQRNDDAAEDDETLGRSESEYSVGGCRNENSKAKSRTPTPSLTYGNGTNATTSGGSHALYSKTPVVLSASPESGFGSAAGSSSSGVALAVAEDYDEWAPSDDDRDGDMYQNQGSIRAVVKPTILGTCKALYDFAGDGEGMAPMKEGDQMLLLERDAGDGWTKVRKEKASEEEGFVPTSYLECKWYTDE